MKLSPKYNKKYLTDLEGKKFGFLTFIKFVDFEPICKNGKLGARWLVKCDCGKEKIVRRVGVLSGGTDNCGCQTQIKMKSSNKKCIGQLTGSKWTNILHNAKNRGHKVKITQNQASKLLEKQNFKCALSGVEINIPYSRDKINESTASLDRIDSNGDYELGNVQWIHKDINRMKNVFPEKVFLDWIGKIWHHKNK